MTEAGARARKKVWVNERRKNKDEGDDHDDDDDSSGHGRTASAVLAWPVVPATPGGRVLPPFALPGDVGAVVRDIDAGVEVELYGDREGDGNNAKAGHEDEDGAAAAAAAAAATAAATTGAWVGQLWTANAPDGIGFFTPMDDVMRDMGDVTGCDVVEPVALGDGD